MNARWHVVIFTAIIFAIGSWLMVTTKHSAEFQLSPIAQCRVVTPRVRAFDQEGNQMWQASAIWIDKRHALTAAHVIGDSQSGEGLPAYWTVGGHRATTATIDAVHDVAMFTIDDEYFGPVAEISTERLNVGDKVVCCGWMQGMGLETTTGEIANLRGQEMADGDIVCAIVCTHGASGGPVFHDGKVIGIVSRGIDSLLVIEPVITFSLEVK